MLALVALLVVALLLLAVLLTDQEELEVVERRGERVSLRLLRVVPADQSHLPRATLLGTQRLRQQVREIEFPCRPAPFL